MRPFTFILSLVLCFFFAALLAGCSSSEDDIVERWKTYDAAMRASDVPGVRTMLAAGLGAELEGPEAGAIMEMRSALVPQDPTFTGVEVEGTRATLSIEGMVDGQEMTGTITFVKEGDDWKVQKEDWNVTMGFLSAGVNLAEVYTAAPKTQPQPIARIEAHEGTVTALAFTRDGERIVSIGYDDFRLCLWDRTTGALVDEVKCEDRPNDFALVPDGSVAYVADVDGRVMAWPIEWDGIGEGQELQGRAGQSPRIAIDRRGERAVTTSWSDPAKLWDLKAQALAGTLPKSQKMRGVAFSPAAAVIAAGNHGDYFALWNIETPSKPSHKKYRVPGVGDQSDVYTIAFSPDGRRIATGHMDSSISIWDTKTGKQLHNWYVQDASTWDVSFSPCGTVLATAHQNGKVYLWEVETARALGHLPPHEESATAVAFNAVDGVTFATGGGDGAIRIWR